MTTDNNTPMTTGQFIMDYSRAFALYLFTRRIDVDNGEPDPLPATHEYVRPNTDAFDEIKNLGWITMNDAGVSLTPLGISIAGPMYSDMLRMLHGNVSLVWKVPDLDYDEDNDDHQAPLYYEHGIHPTGELMAVCETPERAEQHINMLENRSPSDRFGNTMDDAPYRFTITVKEVKPDMTIDMSQPNRAALHERVKASLEQYLTGDEVTDPAFEHITTFEQSEQADSSSA